MIIAAAAEWGTGQWVGVAFAGGGVVFTVFVMAWDHIKRVPPFSWIHTAVWKRHPRKRKP
jgi:hypothetical protein